MSTPKCWPCWNCRAPVTMANRADADGHCPHCEAELDIEDWPFAEPLHPHNDGLDEYREPVRVGELDPAQRLALARSEK